MSKLTWIGLTDSSSSASRSSDLRYPAAGDLRAVQELLGHADPGMTARHAHGGDMAKRNSALFIPVRAG